jgi:hypothetical protein
MYTVLRKQAVWKSCKAEEQPLLGGKSKQRAKLKAYEGVLTHTYTNHTHTTHIHRAEHHSGLKDEVQGSQQAEVKPSPEDDDEVRDEKA